MAYAHDAMGRLMSVSVTPVGGGTPQITFYEYDPVTGARKRIARGNGTSTDFTYDGPERLTKIEHKSTTGSLELGLGYSRDLSGIITGTTETQAGAPVSSWTYGYDGLKRLTSAVCTGGQSVSYAYTYDKAANRLTETQDGITKRFSYNSLDQPITEYSAGDVREFTYDVFGNLVSEKKNGTPEREYTWDGENRLTQVRLCADGDIAEQNIFYGYDSEGTRISKSLKQGSASAAKNTNYLTDYQNPTGYSQTIGELDPADISADRAYAFDDTGLLMQETRPDGSTGGGGGPPAYQTGYTLSDHLGTSRVLTDAQGAAQTRYTYAPFGEVKQGDTTAIHHAFTGQYREGESGLQYHRARWLNTTRASWLSQDPVWDWPEGLGAPYGYCGSNPASVLDAAGTDGSLMGSLSVSLVVGTLVNIGFMSYDCFTLNGAVARQDSDGTRKGIIQVSLDGLFLFLPFSGFFGNGERLVLAPVARCVWSTVSPALLRAGEEAVVGAATNAVLHLYSQGHGRGKNFEFKVTNGSGEVVLKGSAGNKVQFDGFEDAVLLEAKEAGAGKNSIYYIPDLLDKFTKRVKVPKIVDQMRRQLDALAVNSQWSRIEWRVGHPEVAENLQKLVEKTFPGKPLSVKYVSPR